MRGRTVVAFVLIGVLVFVVHFTLLQFSTTREPVSKETMDAHFNDGFYEHKEWIKKGNTDLSKVDKSQESRTSTSGTGLCMEMFTVLKANKNFENITNLQNSIEKMKENMEREFGGETQPYSELSYLLPSLLVRNYPTGRIKHGMQNWLGNLSQLTRDAENLLLEVTSKVGKNSKELQFPYARHHVATVRRYMLAKQANSSYKLQSGNPVELVGGEIPYVPCIIKYEFNHQQLAGCVESVTKTKNDSSYIIAFVGDSKLRNLYMTFLVDTQALNYELEMDNTLMTPEVWFEKLRTSKTINFTEARSNKPPGLQLWLMFDGFSDMDAIDFSLNNNVRRLSRWASGAERAPDLLIIGYGTWMLFLVQGFPNLNLFTLHSLDMLWAVDWAVIRLLLNLQSRTRVLVLAQTRTKPRTNTQVYGLSHATMEDAYVEWVDSMFLSGLKRLTTLLHQKDPVLKASVLDVFYKKSWKDNVRYKILRRQRKLFSTVFPEKSSKTISVNEDDGSRLESVFTDITSTESSQIWFWDSLLPFNLANIRDCDTLYKHDPMTVKLMPVVKKFVTFDLPKIRAMERVGSDLFRYFSEKRPRSGNFTRGYSSSSENFSYLRQVDDISDDPTGDELDWPESREYFDSFAEAYCLPDLHCTDYNHAGTTTEAVGVTQLLNLVCNKHLDLPEEFCCARQH